MKTTLISLGIAIAFTACNNNDTADSKKTTDSTATKNTTPVTPVTDNSAVAFSTKGIIAGYIELKNALAKDNGNDAAAAGNKMQAALAGVNDASLPADKQKLFTELQADLKEHAEHIGANAGKIEHQREHFMMMSKDITNLVKNFGNNGQTLYKDFCPMANDGKGATWISEVKEIQNPYLGSKMPSGTLKETIK